MVVEAVDVRIDGLPRSLPGEVLLDETRKPKNLVDFDADPFEDFFNLPFIAGLWRSADIDLKERYPDVLRGLRLRAKTDAEYEGFYNDLNRRARNLEIGERTANGTVAAFFFILEDAQAGRRLGTIRESSSHSDHGVPHTRRVKAGAHLITLLHPDLHYSGWKNFVALSLFEPFHDVGQIPALLWNKENPEQKIKIKAGHSEEGGCTVDALQGVIAQQGNMTQEMAREVSGITSVMIFAHDVPEKIEKRLNGRIKANWMENGQHKLLSLDELILHYKSGELDLWTTSRSQRLQIMKQIKKESGVLDKGGRRWGMHPEVELAFDKQLKEGDKDVAPLYWDISEEQRQEAVQFALIGGIADMKDMMTPEHAHIRKFNVDASRKRGLYKYDGHSFDRMTGHIGDDTESDYERAMWEVREFLQMTQKTSLWKDTSTRERIINTVLDAYVNTQEFYGDLMRGESGLGRIEKSYLHRVQAIGLKALVKGGINKDSIPSILAKSGTVESAEQLGKYFHELFEALKRNTNDETQVKAIEFERRFIHRLNAIRIESETAIQRIREKPDSQDGKARRYGEEEFKTFQTDGLRFFEVLIELMGISRDDALQRLAEVRAGKRMLLNTGSFDTIGRPKDIKTIKPVPLGILELLDQMEAD